MAAPETTLEAPDTPPRGGVTGDRLAAALVCAVLALAWALPVSLLRSWSYDESTHAELPALRMAVGLREGAPGEAWDALLDCGRYPFVYPVVLAGVQLVTGPSEAAVRRAGRVLWALACFVLFLLAREVVVELRRARGPRPADGLAPWLVLVLAATSPLALNYAGTLYLEMPFVLAAALALRAWVRRDGSARRDLVAGAWLTVAFFTKFNYGGLLGLAAALDLALQGASALRAGRAALFLRRVARLAAVPSLALLGWFVLLRGAEHRAAFLAFMTENTDPSMARGWNLRTMDWGAFFAVSWPALLLLAVGVARTLPLAKQGGVRTLWITAVVFVGAVSWHPFHQDRFLLPGGVALWCLGGLGLAHLAPRAPLLRAVSAGVLVLALAVTAAPAGAWLARASGFLSDETKEEDRETILALLAERRSLSGGRPLTLAGLLRGEGDRLLDLIEEGVAGDERIGWLGVSTELSRAALHIGLLERGGSPDRFLRDAPIEMFLETPMADPGLGAAELAAWAGGFDVVLYTTPVDLKGRAGRRFMQRYVDLLLADGSWSCAELGTALISDARLNTHPVTLHACRRSP